MESRWKAFLNPFQVIRGKIEREERQRERKREEREWVWTNGERWWELKSVIVMWTMHTGENCVTIPIICTKKTKKGQMIQYLHGLRLVHGFDCILCHCPCRKCDKRTACGKQGDREQERQKTTRQKGWTLVKPTRSTRTATGRHCSQ